MTALGETVIGIIWFYFEIKQKEYLGIIKQRGACKNNKQPILNQLIKHLFIMKKLLLLTGAKLCMHSKLVLVNFWVKIVQNS